MKIGAAISPYQHFGICGCDLPDEEGARHLQFYEEDIRAAKGLGLDVFRTGIEWALIEPQRGFIDKRWADFFARYLNYVKETGLEIWLTAHHFTNPKWIWKIGAWESKEILAHFKNYIEFILINYNRNIDYLIIFNEPEIYVYLAYLRGILPPYGYLAYKHAKRAFDNIREAILEARDIARSYGVRATFTHPYNKYIARNLRHKPVAWILTRLSPTTLDIAREMDIVAVNYYVATEVSFGDFENVLRPELLLDLRKYKIAVTEYGIATRNEAIREAYLCHMSTVFKELAPEAAIWWSLLHGYEWGLGYRPFFALLDERRRPTRLALNMRRILESPPRECGDVPSRMGLEWRISLNE
ncbi:family 1 glycosylhydrolase [Thermoproteus tenax]|uniref:Beta-galactosidase n=1 Tax=Thermoproteus tenax (strain ATCC 35583 / DSM 2078 / JCM 9277 / NBRC 100435 / Kra 1) TaxID=768679 RepID=G4RKR3_THETK|nr:family 1 glycosylhydrolase [Thermoproteus tenax]CCC82158.1 beta-galactosidase [Thermoproteus tenax Kra 1]